MARAFRWLATALLLAVVAQFFLAASAAFSTAPNDESFQFHRVWGYVILLLAVLLTILAALARMPGRLIGTAGLAAGLVVLQPVIRAIAAAFGDTAGSSTVGVLIFGLHAVNGLAIMGVTSAAIRHARELEQAARPA